MRELVTQFDLEAAFKALDEIEIPKVKGLKPNRLNISETTKKVDKTSLLVEDYYNVQDNRELEEASAEREAEVAKAKLARIEKIVDIDAETEDDILPSYVGKTIVQCPQCMTLYYRKPEDLVKTEGDESVVNVGEQCPNCGNIDGFNVIGKVAAEEAQEIPAEEPVEETEVSTEEEPVEASEEELPAAEEIPTSEEETAEETVEEEPAELEKVEVEEEQPEETEEEKEDTNESLEICEKCGKSPCECVEAEEEKETLTEDADLDKALAEHNEYIEYLQKMIEQEEEAFKKASNEEVKAAIQRRLDGLKADLDAALPEAVKSDLAVEELPAADEVPEEAIKGEEVKEESKEEEVKESWTETTSFWEQFKAKHYENKALKESKEKCEGEDCIKEECDKEDIKEECNGEECIDEKVCKVNKGINHTEEEDTKLLNEANNGLELTDTAIDELFNSKEFNTPISDEEVQGYLGESRKLKEDKGEDYHQASLDAKAELNKLVNTWESVDIDLDEVEDLDEESCNKAFSKYFTEVYDNVDSFKMTECEMTPDTLIVEGWINFKSGKQKYTTFSFAKKDNKLVEGINKDITKDKAFDLNFYVDNKSLITESLSYNYTIDKSVVKGSAK